MNRKALFFTVVSIFLMSALIFYFSLDNTLVYFSGDTQSKIDSYKITVGNDLIQIIEDVYLPLNIEYTARRSLTALTTYIAEQGKSFPDNNSLVGNFTTLFINGTFYNPLTMPNPELIDDVLSTDIIEDDDFTSRLKNLSTMILEIYGYNFTYSMNEPFIYQNEDTGYDRFGISFTVDSYRIVGDQLNWSRNNIEYNLLIDITGLLDPMHAYHGGYEHPIVINQTENYDINAFIASVENMDYKHDHEGPSFLMRFYNGTFEDNEDETSCCGLVTMINASTRKDMRTNTMYNIADITILRNSFADHCMWNQNCNYSKPGCYRLYDIDGLTSDILGNDHYEFKITLPQSLIYNLSYDLLVDEYDDGSCLS